MNYEATLKVVRMAQTAIWPRYLYLLTIAHINHSFFQTKTEVNRTSFCVEEHTNRHVWIGLHSWQNYQLNDVDVFLCIACDCVCSRCLATDRDKEQRKKSIVLNGRPVKLCIRSRYCLCGCLSWSTENHIKLTFSPSCREQRSVHKSTHTRAHAEREGEREKSHFQTTSISEQLHIARMWLRKR